MDQTRGIDRTKPLADQTIEILKKRFAVDFPVLGGEDQYFKKVAMALISLCQDYYFHHPEELKPYVDD